MDVLTAFQSATQSLLADYHGLQALGTTGKFLDPANGNDTNFGSYHVPWLNLHNIVGGTQPKPGDTVWLQAGTYTYDMQHAVGGLPDAPIKFRALPGQIVIINGWLALAMPNVIWQDVQFTTNTWTSRKSTQTGSNPSDVPNKYVRADGDFTGFINCIFHDMRTPLLSFQASGVFFYGCVSYNHGWSAPDRPHGHSLYIQNNPTHQLVVEDSIFFDSYEYNVHAYAEGSELLGNLLFKGNTSFRAGSLGGTPKAGFLVGRDDVRPDNITYDSNLSWSNSVGLQFYGLGPTNVHLLNNVFPEGKAGVAQIVEEVGNLYAPVGDRVFVRPNRYQPGRANVTIYNGSLATTVTVPSGLPAGTPYRLINVQSGVDTLGLWRDVAGMDGSLKVAADGTITVDMRAASHKVATPYKGKPPATTFPAFTCGILESL